MREIKSFFSTWTPFVIFLVVTVVVGYALWDSASELSWFDQIFTVLDVASANALAVLAFISMLVLATRKYKRKQKHIESLIIDKSKKCGAMVISVGSRGNSDENVFKLSSEFNIDSELIEEVEVGKGLANIDDKAMPEAKEQILNAYNELAKKGVNTIYLMIAGPMPIAFLAGDILSNKLPIYLVKHPEFKVWYVTENNHIKQENEIIEGYEH